MVVDVGTVVVEPGVDGVVPIGVVNTIPVWGGSVACCTVWPSRSRYVPPRLTVTVDVPGLTAT